MSTPSIPDLRRLTPQAATLLLLAAVAWLVLVAMAGRMPVMAGAGALGPEAFVAMWTLMMAAMMLPSVAPVASMYQRSIRSRRSLRLAGFTAGYLVVWAAAGVPAYLLTLGAVGLVDGRPAWATALAAGVFAACGVYQLTSLKTRCLRHCRSPLSLLLRYGGYRGAWRDVRAGAHHGGYCLGCCWMLMALFVVVGVMNLPAMVVLAVVVLTEKLWVHGEIVARVAGGLALVLAVVVIWYPGLAAGVAVTGGMDGMTGP